MYTLVSRLFPNIQKRFGIWLPQRLRSRIQYIGTSPAEILLHNWTVKRISACLIATFLFLLAGCASLKVKMGWKVYLAQTPVASISAKLPKGPGIAPGQKSPLIVSMVEPDGKVLLTASFR